MIASTQEQILRLLQTHGSATVAVLAKELGIGQADSSKITIEDINAPQFDEIKANWV